MAPPAAAAGHRLGSVGLPLGFKWGPLLAGKRHALCRLSSLLSTVCGDETYMLHSLSIRCPFAPRRARPEPLDPRHARCQLYSQLMIPVYNGIIAC